MQSMAEQRPASAKYPKRIMWAAGALMVAAVASGLIALKTEWPDLLGGSRSQAISIGRGATLDLLHGQWAYQPGVRQEADQLDISYAGLKIVEQDGSGGQDNPAVNLYGTHLQTVGNFAVDATLTNTHGPADLRLYGAVPIIQDEFRVEPPSLELTADDSKLRISIWHGYKGEALDNQHAAYSREYQLASSALHKLHIEKHGDRLSVFAGGNYVAAFTEPKLFPTGAMWFGMSATRPGDSWQLTKLRAQGLDGGSVSAVDTSRVTVAKSSGLQSQVQAARPDFRIGAAMALAPLVSDPSYQRLALGGQFGSMTTENALKWQFVHPTPGSYTFGEADAMVALAKAAGMNVHGHALVFSEANPTWVQQLPTTSDSDKNHVHQVMNDYITTTMRHFPTIKSWDVVNEPLADYDTFQTGSHELRDNVWYRAMNEGYITTAFKAARAANPQAKLYINEFGLEQDGPRWDAFLALLDRLKAAGAPIDGVGFQAHVYDASDAIDPAVLAAHMRTLASRGYVSRISETDVYSSDGTSQQAAQYDASFAACLSQPSCVSWTTWGVTNHYDMWQDDNRRLQHGQDLLWDDAYQPTAALFQLMKTIEQYRLGRA